MKRSNLIDWLVVMLLIIILVFSLRKAMSQDLPGQPVGSVEIPNGPLYVCQDPVVSGQFEFHNIPIAWRYPEPGEPALFWIGQAMDDAGPASRYRSTMIVQGLTQDQINAGFGFGGIQEGSAVLGLADYSTEIMGTLETPRCGFGAWYLTMSGNDFTQRPTEEPAPTLEPTYQPTLQPTLAPWPTEFLPTPTPVCHFLSIDFYTNEVTCS